MSLSTRSLCALLCAAMIFSSCAPKRSEVALSTTATDVHRLIGLVQASEQKLRSLVGRGDLAFESPEATGSAFFELALKKPDSLLVKLEGPFGMDVGTLFMSRQQFVMYNSMDNEVTTGIPSSAALRSVIPFDITFDQLLNAFSGGFAIPGDSAALRQYTIADGLFFLSFACGENTCRYWIDPAYLLVTKYQMLDRENQLIMEATSSSLTEQDEVCAPRRITVSFPAGNRQISIAYSSLTLNAPHPSFAYAVPANAHRAVR